MSYDSIEKSNASSKPILFFQFQRGTTFWRYTNADRDVTMSGAAWSAVPVQVGDSTQSGNSDSDTLQLVAPNTIEVAQQYRGQTPSDMVALTIYQAHALGSVPIVTLDAEVAAVWVGEISDVKQGANDRVTISCKTLSSAFDREGLGPTWGRNCDHVIYDHMCRVDRNAYRTTFNLTGVTGGSVTAPALGAHGDGYYDGGYIEWVVNSGVYQRLGIDRQFGNTATLLGATESLSIGAQVSAYPGCPQTTDACINKFNNIANYGGCDIMPGTSPYDGNPVF